MKQPRYQPTTERFLRYVKIPSQGDPKAPKDKRPTTEDQLIIARVLNEELLQLGRQNEIEITSEVLPNGMVLGHVPAAKGFENSKHLCLTAHVDTYPYPNSTPQVTPIVHPAYVEGDINLPANGTIIPAKELAKLVGQRVITSSGDSVLGADDKAGLASIMQAVSKVLSEKTARGPMTILFFPDEEDGRFHAEGLPRELVESWDMFLSVDGGELGEVDSACYSGRTVTFKITGKDAHPGPYGHLIVPAQVIAADLIMRMQAMPTPWNKADHGGYQFPKEVQGEAGAATVTCIPRAFEDSTSLILVEELRTLGAAVASDYEGCKIEVEVKHQYTSTADAIAANPLLMPMLAGALRKAGVTLIESRAEGGTDGAMLNLHFPNVPAPNFGVGAHLYHSWAEFIGEDDLEMGMDAVAEIINAFAYIK